MSHERETWLTHNGGSRGSDGHVWPWGERMSSVREWEGNRWSVRALSLSCVAKVTFDHCPGHRPRIDSRPSLLVVGLCPCPSSERFFSLLISLGHQRSCRVTPRPDPGPFPPSARIASKPTAYSPSILTTFPRPAYAARRRVRKSRPRSFSAMSLDKPPRC